MDLINIIKNNSCYYKNDYFYHIDKISHSMLVNFEKYGPKGITKDTTSTKAMNFGSLVDCILFTPHTFSDEFFICDAENSLSDKQIEIFELLSRNLFQGRPVYRSKITSESNEFMLSLCRMNKIYSSFKDDTVIQKVTSLYESFRKREDNVNKIQITAEEYNQACIIVEKLKTSEATKKIFNNFENYYQVAIFGDKTKVLFDMLLIDEKEHKIIPIDLKVTQSSEMEWIENSFYKFRYYRQAEMYMDNLKNLIEDSSDGVLWTVEDFKFLVVSAQDPTPVLYNFPIKYDREGNLIISKKGAVVPEYHQIVDKIIWHINNHEFEYSEDIINDIYANTNTNKLTYINILD